MNIAEKILKILEEHDLHNIFCLPGGGCLYLVDAISKTSIRPVFNLHEQAASICAEAYGQYHSTADGFGCLLVTTGPGVLNSLTGVAAAYYDSVPMIILSGQCPTQDQIGNSGLRQRGCQETDTEQIVSPIVKKFFSIKKDDNIRKIINDAIAIATDERKGPVWIEVPLDVQKYENPSETYSQYQVLVEKIAKSKQPVFLIGAGVKSDAHTLEVLYSVLDSLKIPVLTTWKTYDLFTENDPLYCGRPGAIAERGANLVLQNADLLITLGARLDLPTVAFNYENFAPNAEKIIVDIDLAELNKLNFNFNKENTTFCNTDVGRFLIALRQEIWKNQYHYVNNSWLKQCKEWKDKYPLIIEATDNLSLYYFYQLLSENLTENSIVVLGSSGSVNEVANQGALKIYHSGTKVIQSGALGSMGFGMSEAIGVAIASEKPVICIEGDGSFAMNMQELATIKALNLPILIFILNNGGYVSIKNSQNNLCDGVLQGVNQKTGLNLPNYRDIASAFGIEYNCISKDNAYYRLPDMVNNINIPQICEIYGNPNHQTVPRTKTYIDENGKLTMGKLENMYPIQ